MTDKADNNSEKAAEQKQAQFEKNAWDIAVFTRRDVADVKGAYNEKRDGLKQIFTEMANGKLLRNASLVATVGLLFTPLRPLALFTAVGAFYQHSKLNNVNKQIGYEISRFKALPPPAAPTEPPKPPAAPLI